MVVVTAFMRMAFLVDVGLLYSSGNVRWSVCDNSKDYISCQMCQIAFSKRRRKIKSTAVTIETPVTVVT